MHCDFPSDDSDVTVHTLDTWTYDASGRRGFDPRNPPFFSFLGQKPAEKEFSGLMYVYQFTASIFQIVEKFIQKFTTVVSTTVIVNVHEDD